MAEIDVTKLLEKKTFAYHTMYNHDFHFIIVGAGGTGGYLIPNLARMVSILNEDSHQHEITVIDADEV